MANLKEIFDPETNPKYKQLMEENPKIDPSFFATLAIADHNNQPIQKVELRLKDMPNQYSMLSNLMEIYAEYSNQYMIYGKKIGSTIEKVVQLTVKDSSKLFELANKDYIEKVSEATNLPEGTYFHVNEVLSGFTKLKQMEKQIDNILSKNE